MKIDIFPFEFWHFPKIIKYWHFFGKSLRIGKYAQKRGEICIKTEKYANKSKYEKHANKGKICIKSLFAYF